MKVYAVGIGPGDISYMAPAARQAIEASDAVVGYTAYVDLIADLIKDKHVISTGMKSEIQRCEMALAEAEKGKTVAVVSSGDAGIYGMASLLFEMAEEREQIEIEVIPGITAATAAASLLGSPLSNDFAVISLSDLLTPWEVIEKRICAAAQGDFVICLYNPQSHQRKGYLERACRILLDHKPPETLCGYVKNALRQKECRKICTLSELPDEPVDMFTTVIIGNAATKVIEGKLVTTRGYMI